MADYQVPEIEDFVSASLRIYSDQVDRTIKISWAVNLLGVSEVIFFISPADEFFDLIVRFVEIAVSVKSSFLLVDCH